MCCTRLCTDACVFLVGETGEITTNTFAPGCPSRLSLIRSFSCLLLVYSKPLERVCSVAPEGENINTTLTVYYPEMLTKESCSNYISLANGCSQVRKQIEKRNEQILNISHGRVCTNIPLQSCFDCCATPWHYENLTQTGVFLFDCTLCMAGKLMAQLTSMHERKTRSS